MKDLKKYGPLLIVIAAVLWGLDGILRRSLYTLPASTIVFYEHLIGALVIAPFTFAAWRKEKVQKRDWLALLLVASLSGVVGTLLFTSALINVNYISISVVFLLQKLQPIFAITAAALLLKEKITLRYASWAALALIAAYFVTFKNGVVNLETGSGTVIAALMAVGAALAWGSSTAFSRYTLLDLSHTLATGLRFFITVPLALLAVFILGNQESLDLVQGDQIFRLILIACTTGMVALWIYYRGLKYTQVKVATFLEFAFPLTGVLVDVYYYHNILAPTQYLAGIILLLVMYRISLFNTTKSEV